MLAAVIRNCFNRRAMPYTGWKTRKQALLFWPQQRGRYQAIPTLYPIMLAIGNLTARAASSARSFGRIGLWAARRCITSGRSTIVRWRWHNNTPKLCAKKHDTYSLLVGALTK